jgi:hypothetical protein
VVSADGYEKVFRYLRAGATGSARNWVIPVDELNCVKSAGPRHFRFEHQSGQKPGYDDGRRGVENQEDWDLVEALGVYLVQGYFIAKPMPMDALIPWYETYAKPAPGNR